MRRTLPARALVFFLVLLVVQSGCATTRKTPTPEERASLGTIGVARASFLPETRFHVPAKGRPAGAVKGAGIAFAGVLEAGARGMSGMGGNGSAAAIYLLALMGIATAAAPVGAVVGAARAMPGDEAAAAETRTREILERMRTQEILRDEVIRAGTGKPGSRLLRVEGVGPAAADNVASYESLAGSGIDTVLEVALLRIALETDRWGSDPPLKFTMKARCRLVRVSDGTVIDDREHSTMSVYRRLSEWTDDDAARLGEAYRDGYRDLATAILRRVFPPRAPAQKN